METEGFSGGRDLQSSNGRRSDDSYRNAFRNGVGLTTKQFPSAPSSPNQPASR